MSKIEFPQPFNPTYRYLTGGEFIPDTVTAGVLSGLYKNAANSYLTNIIDTSNVTNMQNAFQQCTSLVAIDDFDTSNVTTVQYLFQSCNRLRKVPALNTSNVTNFKGIFYSCQALPDVPLFDTSKGTDMSEMFYNCYKLQTIPEFDFSNATSMSSMFYGCDALYEIPNINCKKVTQLNGWTSSCYSLVKIGVIDCDSMTNAQGLAFNSNPCSNITTRGGFRNLGMKSSVSGTNGDYFLYNLVNLTKESLLNVLNLLYDRASAGYSVLTIKMRPHHLAMLTDEEKAIATNKGWTLA